MIASEHPLWDAALIQRYNLSGPRYTSYPTAPQFHSGVSAADWLDAVNAGNRARRPLSLYFHIPFCSTVCYYCGCNKVVTANRQKVEPYLAAAHIDRTRPVDQMHWGGGTPTYLDDNQMAQLMSWINAEFPIRKHDKGEYSIEIHPQTVTPRRLDHLRALGFNRLSFGVQDFDVDVQKAVNRFNTLEEVSNLIKASRALAFRSINLDLIYGLPRQSAASFARTLDQIIALRPDRLSLFNYAHMPHLFKTQKQINAAELPEPQEKLRIFHDSIAQLAKAGYIYIGMDHFALPTDELTLAQNNGTLQRNFQGYSTYGNCDLLAFGASSISAIGRLFTQNYKTVDAYQNALTKNQLPIEKGLNLTSADIIRGRVINKLICQFELKFSDIETEFGVEFTKYFSPELIALQTMHEDGLLKLSSNAITVSGIGRLLIRHICMVFDAYLTADNNGRNQNLPAYSRII